MVSYTYQVIILIFSTYIDGLLVVEHRYRCSYELQISHNHVGVGCLAWRLPLPCAKHFGSSLSSHHLSHSADLDHLHPYHLCTYQTTRLTSQCRKYASHHKGHLRSKESILSQHSRLSGTKWPEPCPLTADLTTVHPLLPSAQDGLA